jgi:glycosyltransferase involved in cell wall biosynthesis
MMMKPIVSIITLTYNQEKYIEDCIKSVLGQTIKEWEMIIIDDGSTDDTPSIIRRFDDSRIVYIPEAHKGIAGLGENYCKALNQSRGEFILILEGDDYIPLNRLEIQIPVFEDRGIVLSHGRYAYVFDEKTVIYPTLFGSDILNNQPLGSALKGFLQGFNPVGTQSVMVRKSALLEMGGFTQPPYLPMVDYPTWMKLSLIGRFMYIPELLGYWRRHSFSITMNMSEQIINGYMKYCDEFTSFFNDKLMDLSLKKFVENRGAIAYLSLAWIKLSNGDWEQALDFVKKSWERKETVSGSFKMKIILAMTGAYLHIDTPRFFKGIMKRVYQKHSEKIVCQ